MTDSQDFGILEKRLGLIRDDVSRIITAGIKKDIINFSARETLRSSMFVWATNIFLDLSLARCEYQRDGLLLHVLL